jgi:hypothetical protein
VEEASDAMLEAAMRRIRRSSPEAFKSWNTKRSFQVTTVTYQLVLLPVWTAVVGPRGQHTVVLVNGQTGEVASGSLVSRNEKGG